MTLQSLGKISAKFTGFALTSAALCIAMTGVASAAAIRTGFSGGTVPRNDDGSSAATALGFTAFLSGTNYTNTFVNNNGNLTFANPLSTFTPTSIPNTGFPIIAPFWADVDTRGAGSSLVTYGQGQVDGRNAFAANYVNVGYYNSQSDKLNSFQVVLIDRSDLAVGNFDIEFNYDQIQWETGSASGGVNGFGGNSARAGYTVGSASFELPGSAVDGALLDSGPAGTSLIANSLNSNVLGRYVFGARNGAIDPNAGGIGGGITNPPPGAGGTTDVPEPFTVIGSIIGGTAAFRMRKKLKSSK
jgi:hypothetical protein